MTTFATSARTPGITVGNPQDADLPAGYHHDGIVQLPGLLGPDEVATIRAAFMDQVTRDHSWAIDDGVPDDDVLARYPRFVHPHRHPDLEVGKLALDYMLDPRIFDVVTSLIGPALGAQSMFYFKPPTARGQAMHQDNTFLRAHPETCLAAWIAIDDVDAENGGLAVVPGSHETELVCPEPADLEQSFTDAEVPIPEGMSKVQTIMKAGDVLFFHGSVVHGSLPNTSTDRFRRSLIFHYIPASSVEIASFYHPLVDPARRDVFIAEATGGGPCGDLIAGMDA
ncbi:protein involved in biosynthesis of mitomycin antibiotics/polyketide fumonisin [Microlunatus endophyticus]|uniref:Protein involved in biosynthesis of mitomycin antibiotics/polyketide fumonisin n=1 Tax=Microlunatus endophyticus TaxID=1716077 RepID=A0A917W0I9_9ACTN|nr:phytanoyl-CoA dioxygenase family protein [Microlunatus endophyticus]GGL52322.1 protein involved in biosynthesis of mitomycin antibiotics/polyketide fumonisin [Microlunatus endophyticus]